MDSLINNKCIFIDLETLGIQSDAIILDMAAIIVDFSRHIDDYDDIVEDLRDSALHWKFDVKEQLEMGRTVTQSTLDWWEKQSSSAKEILKMKSSDISVRQIPEIMKRYAQSNKCDLKKIFWFSRGYADINWLDDLCMRTLKTEPLNSFWNTRDVRTFIHSYADISRGKFEVPKEVADTSKLVSHSSVDDVINDILMIYTLLDS